LTYSTQCPNCEKVFTIRDEQFERTRGKVRCGRCRNKFIAKPFPTPSDHRASDHHIEPNLDDNDSINEDAIWEQLENISEISFDPSFDSDGDADEQSSTATLERETTQADLDQQSTEMEFEHELAKREHLINKVESLIDEKFNTSSTPTDDELSKSINDFDTISTKLIKPKKSIWRTLTSTIVIAVLAFALLYQMWFRHIIEIPKSLKKVSIEPITEPVNALLVEHFNTDLPVRRHLEKLELKSAEIEPHPARASLTLIKIRFFNGSELSQPLPWIELTLTNEEGKTVSRRALSPDSYLHNNKTANNIDARELKIVTLELLNFPKQARGYELRILDK
jgi:predicted Zn finger-like uncharacterized protein